SEHTYSWYRDKLDPFFERFGDRLIASLTYQDGLSYKKWLMEEKAWKKGKAEVRGLGNTSVNHHIRAAKTLLEWACKPSRRQKYGLAVNEWQEIGPLTEKPRERLYSTRPIVAHLQMSETCVSGAFPARPCVPSASRPGTGRWPL